MCNKPRLPPPLLQARATIRPSRPTPPISPRLSPFFSLPRTFSTPMIRKGDKHKQLNRTYAHTSSRDQYLLLALPSLASSLPRPTASSNLRPLLLTGQHALYVVHIPYLSQFVFFRGRNKTPHTVAHLAPPPSHGPRRFCKPGFGFWSTVRVSRTVPLQWCMCCGALLVCSRFSFSIRPSLSRCLSHCPRLMTHADLPSLYSSWRFRR